MHEPALEQEMDEPGGLGRAADLPLGPCPPALAEQRAHLHEHLVDFGGGEALALHRVPPQPGSHAEREPRRLDPLGPRPERAERVGVLGDLAEHYFVGAPWSNQAASSLRSESVICVMLPSGIALRRTACSSIASLRAAISAGVSKTTPAGGA